MKRLWLVALCLCLLTVAAGCQKTGELTSGDYTYYLFENGKANLKGYSGSETNLVLPAQIDEHPITGVDSVYGSSSFTALESVTIPQGYQTIGYLAFKDCKKLTSVELPSTLETIGSNAFKGCESLRELELPQGLVTIGHWAFDGTALETVVLPDSLIWKVSTIDFINPFANCKSLREIIVSDDHPYLRWSDGVLTDREGTKLLIYPAGRTDAAYAVPESIKSLEKYAFSGAAFRTVTLPKNLYALPGGAFSGCENLEALALPAGLSVIDSRALSGCSSLTKLELPDGLRELKENAIENCASLEELIIPKSVETIGKGCFSGCKLLTLSVYPNSVGEQYAKSSQLPYRLIQPEPDEQPTAAPSPQPSPSPNAKPQAANAPSLPPAKLRELPAVNAKGFAWPVPQQGEKLFIGQTAVPQAEKLLLAFVVSSDGTTLHDLVICVQNMAFDVKKADYVQRITASSIVTTYNGSHAFGSQAFHLNLDQSKLSDITIQGDKAECKLAYVYTYKDSEDMSTTELRFDEATIHLENYVVASVNPAVAPPTSDEVEKKSFKLPSPASGEKLFLGEADVAQAERLFVAFVLSADGTENHDLSFFISGVSLRFQTGNSVVSFKGASTSQSVKAAFAVGETAQEIKIGQSCLTDFIITGDEATATLAYVYEYTDTFGSGMKKTNIPFDVAMVHFKRQ